MRRITKGIEPASLAQYRNTPPSDYQNYIDKDELRDALVAEQKGLCCYCLCRIRADRDSMKIEHWHSQRRYPTEQLIYSNLLAACRGNEGRAREIQHCDTSKGDADIKWNPSNQLHPVEQMTFFVNGEIKSRDPEFDAQINNVLNLNLSFLRENRRKILDDFTQWLRINISHWDRDRLGRLLQDWQGEAHTKELRPYCQVVVYWLQKRLHRA